MEENAKTGELMEAMQEQLRQLEHEDEELLARHDELKNRMLVLKTTGEMLEENERLQGKILELQGLLQEEKDRNTKLEMQLNEMSKLSASVAGKASQDELLKALRVFVNKSKRKKMEKRIAVKEMVLELANANALSLPADLAATIDSLDDEQPVVEPLPSVVPEVLAKSKEWQKVKAAGLVDENNQPTVSRPEAALMAEALSRRIGIENKWKMFELMWQRNNMRNDYNTALEQKKSLEFQERLKIILD